MGDQFQLRPQAARSGRALVNEMESFLEQSFVASLVHEGFPVTTLTEQSRSHPAIMDFSRRKFYKGSISSSPSVCRPLSEVKPGLAEAIKKCIGIAGEQNIDDNKLRVPVVEVVNEESDGGDCSRLQH